ncbi:MAG: DUF4276 family protein [Chloroflexi bacterium]|nr:DUF4276 family protein [Chloroflexota bacterium]MCI0577279.1 DUF4276 family protein [Chloroflexota bacterium]MCI0649874.1 DUF4276 family protein [Chloroflexota bacterium]MCI0731032.1 DUF4276 family protein [Chloroflexota bacterium]
MKIVLLVEGDTEIALKRHLKAFLDQRARAAGQPLVRLDTRTGIPLASDKLRRRVERELGAPEVAGVVGLVDVFPNFQSAAQARARLHEAAGRNPGFHAHAAQYDVEAWLLPYWQDICRRVGVQHAPPGGNPEEVNGVNPPAYRLRTLYRLARPRPRKYVKTTEMFAILQDKDLTIAAGRCPEFKAFLNTLLTLSDLSQLP